MTNHIGMPYQNSPQNVAQAYPLNGTDPELMAEGTIVSRAEDGSYEPWTSGYIFGVVAYSAIATDTHVTIFTTGCVNALAPADAGALKTQLASTSRGIIEEEAIQGYTTDRKTGITLDVEEDVIRLRLL